jgi:integrase
VEIALKNDLMTLMSQKLLAFNPFFYYSINKSNFQLLWRRYAQQTNILEPNQTLYSFRHTGAINVYKRFRSVEKVRAVMGHQSINTTLRYLRGLEIETLKQEEMPVIEL